MMLKMPKMSKGIVFKLFVVNFCFYVVFFAAIIGGHFWFFEQFYQNERAVGLEKRIAEFADQYSRERWNGDQIAPMMAHFISLNHVQMVVLDAQGNVRFDNPYRIQLRTDDGNEVPVALSYIKNMEELREYNLQLGDRVVTYGSYYDEHGIRRFSPYLIGRKEEAAFGAIPHNSSLDSLERVEGTIIAMLLPERGQWNNREGIMAAALKEWLPFPDRYSGLAAQGEAFHSEWTEAVSGVHNLVFVQPIVRAGKVQEYIFAITPLTQLGEAFDALEQYYAFFGIAGGLLLIILLSFVFSKLVSRPLISLNRTASRMAQLDFTAIAPMRRNDELGSLSASLVNLSANLNGALKELQLTNEKLVEEMAYKSQLQELQKRFVSDASHELKTPISVVKGFAEGLLDQVAENKRERYVRTIWREADRMERLVADMLGLMRLESGATELAPTSFYIDALAASTVEKLSQLAKDKKLDIRIEGERNARVKADKEKIERVLLNLLSNAIKYGTEGGLVRVKIGRSFHIGAADFDSDGKQLQAQVDPSPNLYGRMWIFVFNEGSQIPQEQLPLIWERFYRGEEARSRKSGGTGLGLAIVKEILNVHASSYGVRNVAEGVEFYFDLASEDYKG